MSSNTVSSFFTRFRRDKSKEQKDPKKRFSVPVFSSSVDAEPSDHQHRDVEITPCPSPTSPALKSTENKTRSPKSSRVKENPNSKSSDGKKRGGALSYLLCMSRNADTIDRHNVTGLPPNPNKKSKNKNFEGNAPVNEAINKENKKASKKKKPVKGWFSVESIVPPDFLVGQEQSKENIYGPMYQPTRGPSQGVRYRVDGTLEKPYVFPSGFTFGPEGRKLKLRRSTPDFKSTKSRSELKLENIQADVHLPTSTSDEFISDQDFFLKFDAANQTSRRNHHRYSMPEVPDVHDFFSPNNIMSSNESNLELSRNNSSNTQPRDSKYKNNLYNETKAKDESNRGSKRNRYKKNRYSMPPKNDDFVYMGSFENLNLCDSLEKRQNAENERLTKEEMKKEKKKNRYSMPPKNPDCVYMGSFENIHFKFNGEKGVDPVLSLPTKDASLSRSYSSSASSSRKLDNEDEFKLSSKAMKTFKKGNVEQVTSANRDSPKNLSRPLAGKLQEKKHDLEPDTFDENLQVTNKSNFPNAFTRSAGRSSCMPGNKRSLAPPPAVFGSVTVSTPDPSIHSKGESTDGKSFKLPPPPNHTPSWEEMEKVQVRLSEIARGCHKGSQADISFDAETMNMEDRDQNVSGLKRISSTSASSDVVNVSGKHKASKEVIYDIPKSNKKLVKQNNTESVHNQQASKTEMDHSNSSNDSVFESSIKVTNTSLPNKTDNKKNSYSNVEIINSAGKQTVHTISKPRNDYEFMYLCSTPQISVAADTKPKPLKSSDSMRLDKGHVIIAPQAPRALTSSETDASRRSAVVTSTPKVVRKPTFTEKESEHSRPVPSPRKRSSGNRNSAVTEDTPLTVVKIDDFDNLGTNSPNVSATTPQPKAAPVPKKRTNLSYSSSACSHSEAEKKFTALAREANSKEIVHQSITSPDCKSQASPTDDAKHIYEDIVINKQPQPTSHIDPKNNPYQVCGSLFTSEKLEKELLYFKKRPKAPRKDTSALSAFLPLSPLQTLKLTSSPLAKRKFEASENWPRPLYTGLSTSTSDLADMTELLDPNYSNWLVPGPGFYDDDNCVADDELSACNEEDWGDDGVGVKVKRGSLRKWASADDIIRSGSIVDRSMILAKRRRLRKRHKKSHPAASTATAPSATHHQKHLPLPKAVTSTNSHGVNVLAKSRKTNTPRGGERPPLNHTDSGHDSDIISPCASPCAIVESYIGEGEEPNPRRQPSASKKSWEVRLQNLQWQRKIRSRENLSESLV
ncbi:uncharacterized protein LOC106074857 [Biomphalaria glabrata]|uniref:Uncharacterized protein LOC106074857 n=1 Tax=Biomphalaria glabrata TaxID=6526 RepID=A0A9U8EK94_BIOGL|nr:uncharacterized protein LOC106074857 [Biomphalaria glabrata]XP_013091191.2 uncharacterized protein LOC106074857 [Biomphalaria glabrata]XP_013091192.2 uncharacterized protein LOC106074857 [Biomphalaria glabrata]XP_055900345.1 uncharacterized protein LOC106074857 [Biomphalaria glabrata]